MATEADRAASRRYRERHPDRVRESQKRHRRSDKGRATAASAARAWRKRNPGYSRPNSLKKLYGMSMQQYQDMLLKQGGVCAICGGRGSRRHLDVDHCHATGRIRGLLCSDCNIMLGKAKDSLGTLRAALEYLAG